MSTPNTPTESTLGLMELGDLARLHPEDLAHQRKIAAETVATHDSATAVIDETDEAA